MTRYEVWGGDDGCAIFPEDYQQKDAVIEPDWKLIRTIDAETWEEAMTKHNELMGWKPYVPMVDP